MQSSYGLRMSTAELPCYTLINVPSDFETPNEMQLKQDLEKVGGWILILGVGYKLMTK